MTLPPDDANAELVERIRRTLGVSPSSSDQHVGERPSSDAVTMTSTEPVRAVGSAALAIADQIMGMEASLGSRSSARLGVRTAAGSTVELIAEIVIGRQEGGGRVVVGDGRVSRSHARLFDHEGTAVVVDLGSSNGTVLVRSGETTVVAAVPMEVRTGDRLETVDGVLLGDIVDIGDLR